MPQPLLPQVEAILRVLADGEEHPRDEVIRATADALPADYGLMMLQKVVRTGYGALRFRVNSFEGMSTEERLREITRQQVKGMRLVIITALNGLRKQRLIEGIPGDPSHRRKHYVAFKITERGQRALRDGHWGILRAEAHAKAIKTTRERYGENFLAENLARLNRERPPEQRHASALKSAATRRARHGKDTGNPESLTPEQRSERTRKSWKTRKENESSDGMGRDDAG